MEPRKKYWIYLFKQGVGTRRVIVKAYDADSAYCRVRKIVRALGIHGVTIGTQAL